MRPTFGSTLRACRLGYRWSDKHGCFIRLSDGGKGLHRMELAPGGKGGVPAKTVGREHRCWWDEPEVLDLIEPLKRITQVKRYTVIYLNDEGCAIAANAALGMATK